jgi:UDP-glucose 6-dehydrogenase
MNVSVVGTGYVGLITAACFAENGYKAVFIDLRGEKVDLINTQMPSKRAEKRRETQGNSSAA